MIWYRASRRERERLTVKEGEDIPKRKVRSKLDSLLRKYILSGGFDIE